MDGDCAGVGSSVSGGGGQEKKKSYFHSLDHAKISVNSGVSVRLVESIALRASEVR